MIDLETRTETAKYLYLVYLFIFAGFLLRIYKWMNYSFWYDEVLWILSAENFSSIKDFCIFTLKPPLFAILLFLWRKVTTIEFFLRLPSLVFGLLNILLSYKIAKVLFNYKIGILTAFIITFSPFHIYYSQELTHYSLTVFLVLASIYLFILCLQKNKWNYWFGYTMATIGCLYTNYVCLFLWFSQLLFYVLFYLKKVPSKRKFWISQGLIFILITPLIGLCYTSVSIMKEFEDLVYHWMPKGNWQYILQTFNVFNLGYHSQRITRIIAIPFFFSLFLLGIWVNRNAKEKILLLLFWLFLPIISSILIGYLFSINIYTHRNFIYASVPYYILIANGLNKLSKKYLLSFLTLILLLFSNSLNNYYQNIFFTSEEPYRSGVHLKQDHRAAAEYIISNFKKGDTVIHVCRNSELPFFYYASLSKKNQ
jgi:4-amino-4-deoxy-L-arabinose transferase-like glycosyltransferase